MVNKESLKNIARSYVQNNLKFIWKIKDASNEKKMIEGYNRRKKMSEQEMVEEVSKKYYFYQGKKLDIVNPKTYTEKIQYRKIYGYTSEMRDLSDKVLVRSWVEKKIGKEYLIPCLGVYDSFDEIDFDKLPERFVIKTNHSSGWNMIVKQKKKFDKAYAKRKFDLWLSLDYAYVTGFEMQYSGIKPKIIIEKYVVNSKNELPDYKFLCFGGEVKYCWVDMGRYSDHRRNVYDTEWNLQPWTQCHQNADYSVPKPINYEKMVDIAGKLCKGFEHVRVDLYNVDGKIYFGEMTFTSASGYEKIIPEKYDLILGNMWR